MSIIRYTSQYRHHVFFFLLLLVLANRSFAQEGAEPIAADTVTLGEALAALDPASDAATTATRRRRLGRFDAHLIDNIPVALLSRELNLLEERHVLAMRLLDSLGAEMLSDTIASMREAAERRVSRLNDFKISVAAYRATLAEAISDLNELASDSLVQSGAQRPSASEGFNELDSLDLLIRRKEIQAKLKLDSLHLLANEVNRLLQHSVSLLTDLTARESNVQVVAGRKNAQRLWAAPASFDRQTLVGNLRATYSDSKDFSKYLKQTEWTGRIFLLLLSVGFFYWSYRKGVQIHRLTKKNTDYNYASDIIKALIFLFTLLPLFSVFTPSAVVQITQLLVFVLLAVEFKAMIDKPQRQALTYLFLFYVLVIFANTVVGADFFSRSFSLLLNVVALYVCHRMRRGSKGRPRAKFRINKYLFLVLILIHVFAMLCNVFGYVEYARYWSIGGVVAIVQSISLVGFCHVVVSAFKRQFHYVSIRKTSSRFDKVKTMRSVRKFLTVICVALGMVVLVINLHSVQQFFNWLFSVLDEKRHVGSIAFTFGNLAVGVVIIASSNWLQKHLAALLGDTSQPGYNQTVERGALHSLMPLFRLLIIIGGFLMGVSALGIGLDKLTVIISALSVGIGFGLQNIINNFVSGIILIFEKPFRTGDFIELADKKGRVQEIGIRSSTLLTQEGSEVIIPNGDLLSGRLVNWTLGKSYNRVNTAIKIAKDSDMQIVKEVLQDVSGSIDYIMEGSEIEMLYTRIGTDMIELKLHAWIVNIYNEEVFRSQLIEVLSKEFENRGIAMVSV
ncbi:mechanosensitive ion channel family protein [Parapedobacter deserti]|uniref:Mechanosensitive ion channel family protein n=1 Tax=Parapedobacter deserti TaxID=1912957 RepID=A0ABV7JMH4_9SPHI